MCVLECVCVECVDVCVSIVSVTVCIRLRYEDVVFGGKFTVNRHLSSAAVLEGLRNGRKAIPNVIKAEQNIAAEIYHTHSTDDSQTGPYLSTIPGMRDRER